MVYAPRQFGPQQIIMTTVTFEVEATLRGGARVGGEVEIPVLGGEYGRTGEIVEGSPRMPLGGRYLLFLQTEPELDAKGRTPDYWLPVLAFFVLPPRKGTPRLPASRDLAAVLEATCAAHPEGIYWGQQVKLVVPSEVIGRNRSDAFEKLVLPHPGGLPRSASVEE